MSLLQWGFFKFLMTKKKCFLKDSTGLKKNPSLYMPQDNKTSKEEISLLSLCALASTVKATSSYVPTLQALGQ